MNSTTIIIVDDNVQFCESMVFMLEAMTSFNVLIYHHAADFLKDYSNDWTGFLLLDLLMPHIDGITLLEKLKEKQTKLYTIVMSGHADKAITKKVKQLGADDFLLKPFDVRTFLEKIQK